VLTFELERLRLGPGMRVLDVGCGQGRHVRATRLVPAVTGVALDLGWDEVRGTVESLRALDALPAEQGGTVPGAGPWGVLRGSGYALPFVDETFDIVIVSEVLEHLSDDAGALQEMSRVLRPGGLLAVSVPRTGPEAVCWALSPSYRNSPGGHVRIYRRSQLERLVESRGYRIVGRHFAHALHSPFWWLRCAMGLDNRDAWPVRLYHRFLVWDMMRRPLLTRFLETALNPFIGKSFVLYAVKH
jgi:SAM-dependent methyltransferase